MLLNVLAVGDVVSDVGLDCLSRRLRSIKKEYDVHFTVVNGENAAVVVVGKLSVRDDKEPQLIVNRVRPMSDFSDPLQRKLMQEVIPELQPPRQLEGTLYLRLPTENSPLVRKIRAILNMFPGDSPAVLFFADTRLRRGTRCQLRRSMLDELQNVLGEGNVVLK